MTLAVGAFALAACSSPQDKTPTPTLEASAAPTPAPVEAQDIPLLSLEAVEFSDLEGWSTSNPEAGLRAMLQSCVRWAGRPGDSVISSSYYNAGSIAEWRTACDGLARVQSASAQERRSAFETHFAPFRAVADAEASKLTGYFEPMLRVSEYKTAEFSAPIPKKPADIVTVDLSQFHESPGPGRIVGKLEGSKLVPYDPRADIAVDPQDAIAWADPADLFYLQIQGSGRLRFPDGRQMRAAYAAHNGQPFKSVARHLIDEGEITAEQASMANIKAWLRNAGEGKAREAMNVNPRYVWFAAEALSDPELGPRGAQGVPLTPMGSMAIDSAFHPYGVPIFIDSLAPQSAGDWRGKPFQSLVVAQDTGGAIKGPLRGDLFFGWEGDAGDRAAVMNHPVAMWVLLPRSVAVRQAEK